MNTTVQFPSDETKSPEVKTNKLVWILFGLFFLTFLFGYDQIDTLKDKIDSEVAKNNKTQTETTTAVLALRKDTDTLMQQMSEAKVGLDTVKKVAIQGEGGAVGVLLNGAKKTSDYIKVAEGKFALLARQVKNINGRLSSAVANVSDSGACVLRANGSYVLKSSGKVFQEGERITQIHQNELPKGETCQSWADRTTHELVTEIPPAQ